jgi:ribosomal-protein-alanine N-acetyltransferase
MPETATVTIRDMHWWDAPAVHAIEVTSFPETAWSVETLWAELAGVPDTRRYWVAESADQIVGYAGFMVVAADADVQTIAVSSAHRSRGIGTALLETAIAEATRRHCSHVMLEVAADNLDAGRLYERHGFETIARRSSYYGAGRDALVMRARLGAPAKEGPPS